MLTSTVEGMTTHNPYLPDLDFTDRNWSMDFDRGTEQHDDDERPDEGGSRAILIAMVAFAGIAGLVVGIIATVVLAVR